MILLLPRKEVLALRDDILQLLSQLNSFYHKKLFYIEKLIETNSAGISCLISNNLYELPEILEQDNQIIEKVDLRHGDLPDPIAIAVASLDKRIKELEVMIGNQKKSKKEDIEIFYGDFGGGI